MKNKGEWKPSKRQPALPAVEKAAAPAPQAPISVPETPSFLGVVFQPAFWNQVWTEWSEHLNHEDDGDLMGHMMLQFMSERGSEFAPGAACISAIIVSKPLEEFLKLVGHLVPADLRWIFEGDKGHAMYAGVQRRLLQDFTEYVFDKGDCLQPEIHRVVHDTVRAYNVARLTSDLRANRGELLP